MKGSFPHDKKARKSGFTTKSLCYNGNMRRLLHKNSVDYIIVGILVSATVVAGAFLSSARVNADDDSVVDEVSIKVPDSCTLSGTGMNSHTDSILNGQYSSDIGTTTMKVYCNDSAGFAIYAIGFTGDKYDGEDHTKLIGASTNEKIITGTATSAGNPDRSEWAMKLATNASATYPLTLDNSFGSYHTVPDTYTKVAHRDSATDVGTGATGAELTSTYAAYISSTQPADTYTGKVKYTLVHPSDETPLHPETTQAGKICYYPNGSNVAGTMGCQNVASSVTLLASNFSRTGYGFAGWSDKFDYSSGANFYGPNETIALNTADYSTTGLSLYAVWVKSVGSIQDSSKVASTCSRLITAPTDGTATLSSVSALTDQRDNQTYAIAKLADGNCWMIENLRLDNTAELTLANTNNPLNNGTNVTLKHNYTDTDTYNTLSATSSVAYDADTAPDGWCTTNSAACDDQSRLRTDNTTNRATYTSGQMVTSQNANTYSYGNYYNWYSATAGRGTYSFSTNNNSVAGDLCPSGWRLPVGGQTTVNTTGDFYVLGKSLMKDINGDSIEPNQNAANGYGYYDDTPTNANGDTATKVFRKYPNNYLYSGGVNGGSVYVRGSYGNFWSSTADYNNYAYYLLLRSSNVYPGTGNFNKYSGWAVRCLAQ